MGAVVDVLDAGGVAQLGGAGAALEALLLAQGLLVFEEDASHSAWSRRRLRGWLEVLKPSAMPCRPSVVQEVEGGMGEHRAISFNGSSARRAGSGDRLPAAVPRQPANDRGCWR